LGRRSLACLRLVAALTIIKDVIVPNFIPDPLEVPSNVTEQPYRVRLWFIRRVTWLFTFSVAVIGFVVWLDVLPSIGIFPALLLFAALLVGLEIWRILTRGKRIEDIVSGCALPVVLASAALVGSEVHSMGYPLWQLLVAPTFLLLYTALCGRDYSFVGGFLLSLIGSAVTIAAIGMSETLPVRDEAIAQLSNVVFLFYIVYDLASLLSRRRLGEEVAAVTDLYRDVFNVFGYVVRVVRHWRRHRIWSMPTPLELKWKGKA
jgi:FtsH-binding integral membrane protein